MLYRVWEPYKISLILLKMMYRKSICDLFDRLFEGVQKLYCSPEKKEKLLAILIANVLSKISKILKNFTLDDSNFRKIINV